MAPKGALYGSILLAILATKVYYYITKSKDRFSLA